VRLDRPEFERLIAADVDRLAALVTELGGQTGAGRVLLVGGSSRIPLLARRLAETAGLPVTTDPEPETAVARGAQLLSRPAALEDPLALPPGSPPPSGRAPLPRLAPLPDSATPTGSGPPPRLRGL
jgi:sugar (pentulose or hexulose) kinase